VAIGWVSHVEKEVKEVERLVDLENRYPSVSKVGKCCKVLIHDTGVLCDHIKNCNF
jgi:hypothetical protein